MRNNTLVKFKKFATVNPGQSPKSKYYSDCDGVPFLQGNRTFGLLYPIIDTYTTKITKIAEAGEILMSVRAPVGDLNFAKERVCIGRGVAGLKAKDGDNKFLFYCLKYNIHNLIRQGGGTTYNSVNKDVINDFELILPATRQERKLVSKVLSGLDAKIEVNNKINQELEAMAKTLYDYWFVQFDFPDENGKPYKSSGGKMVFNGELKREIPEGWESGTFETISTIIGGSTPSKAVNENFTSDKYMSWITPKDLSLNKGNKFITRGEWDVTELGINSASLKIMPRDTVLLSSRAPIGYLAISTEEVTTNQGFKSFVPKENYSTEFVFYCVKNQIPKIEAYSSGSTFKEVSGSTLKTIHISIPTKDVLVDYNKISKPIFRKQKLMELENQKLSELRDWLLPMLMNGQVTVGSPDVERDLGDGESEMELAMVAEEGVIYKESKN